jgi:hypothetical protein
MSAMSDLIRRDIALELLAKAHECEARAKALGQPNGSTEHLCANVWRAAAAIACQDVVKENRHD